MCTRLHPLHRAAQAIGGNSSKLAVASLTVLLLQVPLLGQDFIVAPGYDLLETLPANTLFMGFNFEGVPLEDFTFGTGLHQTGKADTIIQRIGQADSAGMPGTAPPIPIEMVALQLKSVQEINLGSGMDFYFITLQAGTPSTGTMTITFDDELGGTFDSSIDVAFDIRVGSLTGPIVPMLSGIVTLDSLGTVWDRDPPARAIEIEAVNILLNGSTRSRDFWPNPIYEEKGPDARHAVKSAEVVTPWREIPTLGSIATLFLLLLLAGYAVWKLRHSSAQV